MEQCVMLSARELSITWGDNPEYWTWVSHPDSRFEEVAELLQVCWLDISGRLKSTKLSPNTTYVAYLIFKLTEDSYGFDHPKQNASITTKDQHSVEFVCLERETMNNDQDQTPSTQNNEETNQIPHVRKDGWFEVVMGEFFNDAGGNEEEEVVVRLFETEVLNWKSGLVVEGIEFRPNNYFMLSARELSITWGDNPEYWTWVSHPDSRFKEVAELLRVCWLDISGRLKSTKLSRNTTYVAYLIFKLTEDSYGFDRPDQNASVIIGDQHSTKIVCLERVETTTSNGTPQTHGGGNPNAWIMNRDQAQTTSTQQTEQTNRSRGWFEVDVGEFFNWGRNNEEVVVRLFETERLHWKRGLIVEGIEFRPKNHFILSAVEGIEFRPKNHFMLSARELSITWGDNPEYWTWVSHPDSRFEEVAELLRVCWLDISGRLESTKLSPNTTYVAYLIFKLTEDSYGFDRPDQNASVIIGDQHSAKTVCLERVETTTSSGTPQTHGGGNPNAWIMNRDQAQTTSTQQTEQTNRSRGWFEVDVGEFFNWGRNNEEVVVRLFETERLHWKRGLIVEGIEFRPKN